MTVMAVCFAHIVLKRRKNDEWTYVNTLDTKS